mmetsp:Transcript_535/g.1667  ORF Transcript_535/g.1667 Transcript_535/m.1667 type:complete len:293 (-) Transcript_535:356-1234(-)
MRLAKAKRNAGNSEALRTNCTHVSCKYGVSLSPLCNKAARPTGECWRISFLPCVSNDATFNAHTAASRTFASPATKYCVATLTPAAFRNSLRPLGSLPQCHRTRSACRKISTESSAEAPTNFPSCGTTAKKPTIRSINPTPNKSFMPPLAYMVTAARVCNKYNKHSESGSEGGKSGSVAHKYCAMLRTLPWSTTCWHPSLNTVTDLNAWATFIFTSSSLQWNSSFANRGNVGPAPKVPISALDICVFPIGIWKRPPIKYARPPIARAASRCTSTLPCASKFVAAATASDAIA